MSNDILWHKSNITTIERASLKKQKPTILWFTGLSGSGKSSLANAIEKRLYDLGHHTFLLDGDNLRYGLNADLGFDEEARVENIRRVGEVSKLFIESGLIVLSAFISPFVEDRDRVRSLVQSDEFIEIYVDTPLNICEQRDVKGLYKKARAGEIKNFTGIDSPYETPVNPEIYLDNSSNSLDENVDKIVLYLEEKGFLYA